MSQGSDLALHGQRQAHLHCTQSRKATRSDAAAIWRPRVGRPSLSAAGGYFAASMRTSHGAHTMQREQGLSRAFSLELLQRDGLDKHIQGLSRSSHFPIGYGRAESNTPHVIDLPRLSELRTDPRCLRTHICFRQTLLFPSRPAKCLVP